MALDSIDSSLAIGFYCGNKSTQAFVALSYFFGKMHIVPPPLQFLLLTIVPCTLVSKFFALVKTCLFYNCRAQKLIKIKSTQDKRVEKNKQEWQICIFPTFFNHHHIWKCLLSNNDAIFWSVNRWVWWFCCTCTGTSWSIEWCSTIYDSRDTQIKRECWWLWSCRWFSELWTRRWLATPLILNDGPHFRHPLKPQAACVLFQLPVAFIWMFFLCFGLDHYPYFFNFLIKETFWEIIKFVINSDPVFSWLTT